MSHHTPMQYQPVPQTPPLQRWRQPKVPVPATQARSERRARIVLYLTLVTMVVELVAGYITGSLALVADGWHMGSHAAALGIAAFAYAYARKHATSERFSFGTGKVGALAGYSSALLLAVVAVLVAFESVERLLSPEPVNFRDALIVAVIGFAVNITSAMLLGGHAHGHDHGHGHQHSEACKGHEHVHHEAHDHNLRAAYFHVVADALTSVLAIGALLAGLWFNLGWLDPLVAIAASLVIAWWAWGLMKGSGQILLDADDGGDLKAEITRLVEADADNRVADLRLWRLGGDARAAIVSIVTHQPRSADHYKRLIVDIPGLHHVTVEVHLCDDPPCGVHDGSPSPATGV
jgi:cation diffusion facilitator family transporter